MTQTCRVPGCSSETASRFSQYCRNHKARLRRHGAVDQEGVTAKELKPYIDRVRRRIEKNADSTAWGTLDARWEAVHQHAKEILRHFESGRPGPAYERRAAHEVAKLVGATVARDVVVTALAMFMMQRLEPRRFRSDTAFRFELVHRVRSLGSMSAGQSYDHTTGKVRNVYRELAPRAVTVLGGWIAEAFGTAGLHLTRLEEAEAEQRVSQRVELYKALGELK
jgi:hypothetical protein